MSRGKAVGARVLADVAEAQRGRVANQLPQHAAAKGQIADSRPRLLVDPDVDEALQPAAVLIEDADRGVARAGQLAPDLDHFAQHSLEVKLGGEAPTYVDKSA